jgi:type IV secretion system protein TrbL
MTDFNSLFPNFLSQCTQLKTTLMPVAYLLLVVGMISSTITGQRSAGAYMRTVGRTVVYIMLLTYLVTWGNQISQIVNTTTTETIQADPANVFNEYNAALVAKKSTSEQTGWWDKLFHAGTTIFEAIVSGFLWLFGLLASAILFYAYIVQKMILYLGYSLSPIFIGFMAIRSLNHVGQKYIVGLVGVMAWPLGWAVAAIVTQGLLTFMTDQSFLQNSTLSGGAGYGLQNFIGVGLLGVWLIFSTIAAPIIIQKALTEGYQAGAALLTGATGAALSGLATGATTAAALGASGGNRWATAGLAATAGAAAATNAVAGSAFTNGHGASLINTLAYQNERVSARSKGKGESSSRFDANDVTGAKAVRNLIDGTRGSDSPKSNS